MAKSTCCIPTCERAHMARGWCSAHYRRWQKYGDPEASAPRRDPICAIADCDSPTVGRGWCRTHYQRWQRHGDPTHVRTRQRCNVDGCDSYRHSRGWCSKHYTRWKRYGEPTARIAGEVRNGCRICPGCKVDRPVDQYSAATGRCKSCVAAEAKVKRLACAPVLLPAIHCIVCAARFIPDRGSTYCCSVECSDVRKRQMDAYYHAVDPQLGARRRYQQANPDVRVQIEARRRARRAGATAARITRQQISARMAYFGNRCWMCGGPFEAIDHVKPLSKGGPHIPANLRPSCAPCNGRKSNRWDGIETVLALAA